MLPLALMAACKRTPRHDPRAVIPLVPGGPTPTEDAGRRSLAPRAQQTHHANRAIAYITDRPAADGALALRWGTPRADLAARNTTAHIECRDSSEYTFCRRALVELPLPGVITYEFCGASGLCAISIDCESTRDEARLADHYDRLLALVRASLGAPSDAARRIAPGCAGHLALCLTSKQSELTARWTWREGPQVQLSVDQDEENAFQAIASVTWFSAERARRQDAIEAPSPSARLLGDASTDQ
jgi:hypothetical protein